MTGRYCIVAIVNYGGGPRLDIRYTSFGGDAKEAGERYAQARRNSGTLILEYAVFAGTASLLEDPIVTPQK
jgi:hypothetical protein